MRKTRERSRNNPWIRPSAFLVSLFALASCTSPTKPADRVIERSRQIAPDWVSQAPQGLEYRIFQKTRVYDLPLGLQQAQNAAVLDLQMQLRNKILNASKSELGPQDTKTVDRELQKLLKQRVSVKDIVDIYFEKIEMNTDSISVSSESFYRISILTHVEQTRAESLARDLRRALELSGHSKLASAIKAEPITTNK